MARNFSCGNSYTECNVDDSPSQLLLALGNYGNLGGTNQWNLNHLYPSQSCTCSNSTYANLGLSYSWSSGNSSIASITNGGSSLSSQWLGAASGRMTAGFAESGPYGLYCQAPSKPVQVQPGVCRSPNTETTIFYKWGDTDPLAGNNASAAGWIQTLAPSGTYGSGTVSEGNASPATDSCYFNGSSFPPVAGVTGSSWLVGSDGRWGPDYVGYTYVAFAYYQSNRPRLGYPMPCGFTMFQRLSFQCPQGNSGRL
jgi:hypothetical protein